MDPLGVYDTCQTRTLYTFPETHWRSVGLCTKPQIWDEFKNRSQNGELAGASSGRLLAI